MKGLGKFDKLNCLYIENEKIVCCRGLCKKRDQTSGR